LFGSGCLTLILVSPRLYVMVITAAGIVKVFDLVVSLTAGGPSGSSELPAKYVYDLYVWARQPGTSAGRIDCCVNNRFNHSDSLGIS